MNDQPAAPAAQPKPQTVRERVKASVAKSITEHRAAREAKKAEEAAAAAKATTTALDTADRALNPAPVTDQPAAPAVTGKASAKNPGPAAQE